MKHNIIYLSHGGQKYYDQTRLSVLTLLHLLLHEHRSDIGIVVYCDMPNSVPQHDLIRVIPINSIELNYWRGPMDFVNRIKLEVLRRASQEIGPPFIYVDCDTRWLRIPDQELAMLATANSRQQDDKPAFYMHKAEGEITSTFFPQYFHFLVKSKQQLQEWGVQSTPPWTMWNSGVIGVPRDLPSLFFEESLLITDQVLIEVRYRFCIEQLAISLIATSRFKVMPFDDCLHHYWSFNFETPIVLHRFFAGLDPTLTVEQQAEQCGHMRWDETELRAIQNAPSVRFHRWWTQLQNSFYKRRIDFRAYRLRRAKRRSLT